MTKIKNKNFNLEIFSTDEITYSGKIPECIIPEDCIIDKNKLTYIISLLLEKYCESVESPDIDLSTIDLSCLITSNPNINIPSEITIDTLLSFYKDHFCALYTDIEDVNTILESLKGIYCINDIVQIDQNEAIVIDPLFNDLLNEVTGIVTITILTSPINGTASTASNQITYIPDLDFFGNDQITYQVTKGSYSCIAKISIRVNEIITNQTITDIVNLQITNILTSNEFWDIGIPIGTKMSITESNLVYFNLLGVNWGNGLPTTKWSKWSICNGNNGTDNEKGLTTRGFDINNSEYNDASPLNSRGSDSLTIDVNNIPAHRHTFSFLHRDVNNNYQEWAVEHTESTGGFTTEDGDLIIPIRQVLDTDAGDANNNNTQYWIGGGNTGNGVENINNQDELLNTPNNIDNRNAYFTEIKIQKIL